MTLKSTHSFNRHRGPVTGVAEVPTSKYVITSGYDGAVGIFNYETQEVELLGYHDHLVNGITISSEGKLAASASSDYTIYIWDIVEKKLLFKLAGHQDDVEDFIFVDEQIGVSASRDHSVIIWNLEDGKLIKKISGHEKDVLSLAYDDGKIFSSGDDMTLRVWDLKTGELLRMWGPFETETDTCAIDPQRDRVVLGCDDGMIRIFDTNSGELLQKIDAHTSGIKKVAVSPINGDILSAAYDQKILIWDAQNFELKKSLEPFASKWERSFNWSNDGKLIFAGTFDGTVVIWDVQSGKFLQEIGEQASLKGNPCFNEVAVNELGQVVLCSDDGYIRLAQLTNEDSSWLSTTVSKDSRMLMNAITMSEPNQMVVGGAHNQKIHIFTKAGHELKSEITTNLAEGPINSVRVSNHPEYKGDVYVACYSGAIVQVGKDGNIKNKFNVHENAVKALELHPSKPIGVSCSADGILVSWNLNGAARHNFIEHAAIINDISISPSGKYVASVGRDFMLKVHNLEEGTFEKSFPLGKRSLKSVNFVDDQTVVIGDYWGGLIKVDIASGEVLKKTIARNGISSLCLSNEQIVASSYDGNVYLVNIHDLSIANRLVAMQQRLNN